MAEVFLARRKGPGGIEKQLVVKRIRRELARDARFLDLFLREAKLSMSLAHKNIVPVFDFGRVGDELFLAMEYIDGCDLGNALERSRKREQPVDPLVAVHIAMEACQALDYAHRLRNRAGDRMSVVHRDVTPRNVLLSRSGEVKLADFGVATTETDLGEAGKVRGTPAYMAPEQARGEAVDARTDVFGLGLVLWEMLAGDRAYRAEDSAGVLALARIGEVAPLPDHIDERLREIVAKATAPIPDDRYDNARELQLALDVYLLGARSERGMKPPGHLLAEWVQALFPGDDRGEVSTLAEGPSGSVVTFLDDGPDRVAEALTVGGGATTMRSVAETVAESDVADSDADVSDAGTSDAGPHLSDAEITANLRSGSHPGLQRSKRSTLALVAGSAALLAGGAVALVLAGGSKKAAAPPIDAAAHTAEKAPPDAAVKRVAVAPPADAAVAVAQLDAAPVPKPRAVVRRHGTDGSKRGTRPPPVKKHVKKTSPPDAGVAGPPGTVKVSATPWAAVKVRGRSEGCRDTPCTLRLPPGRHVLLLRNPVANLAKQVTVTVTSGATVVVRETLTRGP
jgi:tRNA A-37 threonylcarbamoyl transferase component Bud32